MGEAGMFSTTVLGWALGAALGQVLSDLMTARGRVPFDAQGFALELAMQDQAKLGEIKRDFLHSMNEGAGPWLSA